MYAPSSPPTGAYFGSYFSPSNLSHHQTTPPIGGQYFHQAPQTYPQSPLTRHGRFTQARKSDDFEPMSTSPSHQHSPNSNNASFLPAFLAGESSSMGLHLGHRSPEVRRRLSTSMGFESTGMFDSPKSNVKPSGDEAEVPFKSGPPVTGLGGGETRTPLLKAPGSGGGGSEGFSPMAVPIGTMPGSAGGSPTECTTHWVTVFGFPSSSSTYVFQQFSQYGTILEVKSSPGANWTHFKYSSTIEARRAINKNGTVLSGTMMVGVVPCEAPGHHFSPEPSSTNVYCSPSNLPAAPPKEAPLPPSMNPQLKGRIRALGLSNNVAPPEVQVPKPNNGIVSSALEWLFGW